MPPELVEHLIYLIKSYESFFFFGKKMEHLKEKELDFFCQFDVTKKYSYFLCFFFVFCVDVKRATQDSNILTKIITKIFFLRNSFACCIRARVCASFLRSPSDAGLCQPAPSFHSKLQCAGLFHCSTALREHYLSQRLAMIFRKAIIIKKKK